jgi:hypothetical protein
VVGEINRKIKFILALFFWSFYGYLALRGGKTGWMMNLKELETFVGATSAFARRY